MEIQLKVLIADDDPVSLLFLQETLKDSGYEVETVTDGTAAFNRLKQATGPQLATLDWMMPEMDGVTVCRQLRDSVRDRYIYLILLTSRQGPESAVEAMDAGADDFISKPYSIEELQARLRTGRRISNLEQELRAKATRDALTGLYNRGTIIDILQNEMARKERGNYCISLIFADIDHFKKINDSHGHLVGDAVLRDVAERMTHAVRPYDGCGRFGGEELMIVLPECDRNGAIVVAERVRAAIADGLIQTESGELQATISVGVATAVPGSGLNFTDLIQSADKAMYQAKSGGRNCVRVSC
jgi:diguanylate cyclase (GGDEF)-like protein